MKILLTTLILLLAGTTVNATVVFYTDFGSFDAASTATLTDDFESYPTKDSALASIYSNGITYTPTGSTNNVWISSPGYTYYNIPGQTTSSILTATGDENFIITPDSTLSAIGFDVYLNNYTPAYLNVYSASGLLDSFDLTLFNTTQINFLGMTASEAIVSLEWFTTEGRVINTGIDNVYTQVFEAVPEPAIIILLLPGLLSIFILNALTRRKLQV